jgi:tetratricopeptide (TPR) repeat protein
MPETHSDSHPDHEVFRRFLAGESGKQERRQVMKHLLSGCESCRRLAGDSWQIPQQRQLHDDLALEESESLQRVTERLAAYTMQLERDRVAAPALIDELMQQPQARRRILLENSSRYCIWAVADRALDDSQKQIAHDPERALGLAELGLDVAQRLNPLETGQHIVHDIQGRAWGTLANARRVLSDLRGAEAAFHKAEEALAAGTGDPLEEARYHSLLSTLRSDQRRFDESLTLIRRAARTYRYLGEDHLLGRTLVMEGTTLGNAGDTERAIQVLERAIPLLDESSEPRVGLAARHNIVRYLRLAGRIQEALELLRDIRPIYRRLGNRQDIIRLRWAEGELARDLNQPLLAENAFLEVRKDFIEGGVGFDAALVSMDLALLFLEQGRYHEVQRLALEMKPIFESRDIHREAVAALLVFCHATERKRLTAGLVREISQFLQGSRHDPGKRFVAPAAR